MVKLLLIDDDEIDRQAIKRALLKTGLKIDVTEAKTAKQGLALLAKNNFDCVLLDYRLPDANGLQVLEQHTTQEIKETTPFVLLTGQEDEDLALKALRAGAQDFLNKDDISPAQLTRAIVNVVERQELTLKHRVAEKELVQQAKFLNTLYDTMVDGLVVIDKKSTIISANKAILDIFQYTEKELIGRPITDLMTAKGGKQHLKNLAAYLKTRKKKVIGKGPLEMAGFRKNGKQIYFELAVETMFEKGQQVFVASVRNITERKESETAFLEIQEKLKLITENANDIITLRDVEGNYTYLSPSFTKALGHKPENYLKKSQWKKIIHPEDRAKFVNNLNNKVINKGESFTIELRILDNKGNYNWFESNIRPIKNEEGKIVASVSISRNINDKKLADDKTKAAEERYKMLADYGNDIISLRNVDGDILYVSPAIKRHLGHNPEDLINTNVWRTIHRDDAKTNKPLWDKAITRQNKPYRSRVRLRHKNGNFIWFENITVPVIDENGKITAAVTTSRNIADLREAEEKFRLVAENANDIITLRDADAKVTYVSPSFERHLGRHPDEHIGTQSETTPVHPDEVQTLKKWKREVFKEGKRFIDVFRVKAKNGKYVWFQSETEPIKDTTGKVTGAVTVSRNFTKQKEEEIRRVQLGQILDNSLNEVFIFNAKTLKFIFANQTACKNIGYSLAELQKMTPIDLSQELKLNSDEFKKNIKSLISGAKEHFILETINQRKNGSAYDVKITLQASEMDNRQVILSNYEDTTVKKEIDAKLRQAQKMDAVGQLTGGIAHDFNNLLTALQGGIMLAEMEELSDRVQECLDISSGAIKRGADLTQRLLAFSRIQALKPEVVEVNALVKAFQPLLKRTLGENIEIQDNLLKQKVFVKVDIAEYENIILNLSVNARDAMPDGGQLTLEVYKQVINHKDENQKELNEGKYIVLSVSDNGTGMPPEITEHIFEPFFTTKAVDKGTGLGLSTVFGFVKQSGGHITVYSEMGKGTTFRIYLPEVKQISTATVKKVKPKKLSNIQIGKILLVEDNQGVRQFVAKALQAKKHIVIQAEDGTQAVTLMKNNPDIDLLLTDVVLPKGMDGLEVGKKFKKLFPNSKIIYSSGFTLRALERTEPTAVAELDGLLSKPYDLEELYDLVDEKLTSKLKTKKNK